MNELNQRIALAGVMGIKGEPPKLTLDWLHEFEKKIPHLPYLYRLQEVCGGRMETSGDLARIIRASVYQRSEALLRTLGLWIENQETTETRKQTEL